MFFHYIILPPFVKVSFITAIRPYQNWMAHSAETKVSLQLMEEKGGKKRRF